MEQIYTIPVNEAFDASAADSACGCPLCALYTKLEENELDLILGASMMEPDVRIKTNAQGFCRRHLGMMFTRKNRLGLALMLESHLDTVKKDLSDGGIGALFSGTGGEPIRKLGRLDASCYICARIEGNLSRMLDTVLLLWREDSTFRRKFAAQPFFCLPHYRVLLERGKAALSKKEFGAFYEAIAALENRYTDTMREDIRWFCKKFDYRYADEPWKNSKDAVERAIRFLRGCEGAPLGGEKK